MSRVVIAAYVVCAAIWGTTWYAIRVCIGDGAYPTLVGVALRFAIAAVVLAPIAARLRPWPRGRTRFYLVLAGALDAAAYTAVYPGQGPVARGGPAAVYATR